MKTVISFLFLMAVSSAQGAETKFATLLRWHTQGTPLTFAQMRGFYSGRCFSKDEPDVARNGFLGYVELPTNGNAGPGFPAPAISRYVVELASAQGTEDYYDDMGDIPAYARSLRDLYSEGRRSYFTTASDSPTLSYTFSTEPGAPAKERTELRKYNQYVVSRTIALHDNETNNSWTNAGFTVKRGETSVICYYFRKLGE